MWVSAELRWFWRGDAPEEWHDWFVMVRGHGCAAGGGKVRVDRYFVDAGQPELGIKMRGGPQAGKGAEIKGLVATAGLTGEGAFRGEAEIWCKWSSSLELGERPVVAVSKRRWARKFAVENGAVRELELGPDERPLREPIPPEGCNVELTEIRIGDTGAAESSPEESENEIWWTFGFEAFGDWQRVTTSLAAAVTALNARRPPELEFPEPQSYPAWLISLNKTGRTR